MTGYGPLARLYADPRLLPPDANAALLFHRGWYGHKSAGVLADDPEAQTRHLQAVADAVAAVPDRFLTALHRRRGAAVDALAAAAGASAMFVTITPAWRVVIGHGENGLYESGLTLSPVYGVPVLPGSALKGMAAASARSSGAATEAVASLFGSPRPGQEHAVKDGAAAKGVVTVLDALPVSAPRLIVDVLTPHVKPYYDQVNNPRTAVTVPPAEYHNPVPVRFLAVGATEFRTALIGPAAAVRTFFELLREGFDELGIGGKTAAGDGYCQVQEHR